MDTYGTSEDVPLTKVGLLLGRWIWGGVGESGRAELDTPPFRKERERVGHPGLRFPRRVGVSEYPRSPSAKDRGHPQRQKQILFEDDKQ